MKKLDCVWNIFLGYLILIFFILLAGGLSAQSPCKEDICVVEFNAGWNEANGVNYLDKLTDCGDIGIGGKSNTTTKWSN
jgi:hypothetical protein